MVHNSWQKRVNMSADDIYLVISPHMIDNCRREGAVLLLSSDDVGVKARKGEMVDCECVGVWHC